MDSSGRGGFDPYGQNVTFLAADGSTSISIPIPVLNLFNDQTVAICLNYASQLGACAAMLAVVLVMTPSSKLRRPSNVLHVLGLVLGLLRMVFLSIYFVSPFSHFYQVWGEDYQGIALKYYQWSNTSTVLSFLLVVVVQAALMNQAWTMVSLWPNLAKYALATFSGLVALLTTALRLALTIVQIEGIMENAPPMQYLWLAQGSSIMTAISTCWFCAMFNLKLVHHLISNRGVLPSRRALNPMEILIMTNGILMIIPVIFTGLEWAHFATFEAGSLALTSVILILPLGTLAAQRVAQSPSVSHTSDFSGGTYKTSRSGTHPSKASSRSPFSTNGSSTTAAAASSRADTLINNPSRSCEEGTASSRERLDPIELELRHIEGYHDPSNYRRMQRPGRDF
ncbi:hypothetical protein PT974_03299 [Cladobotryum mycophilum]|uniref:Pheromone receptor n=1 Tax=Cladobotryum mycophilum TaxID=491253 RepID=A0ABR0ST46_9HYPO